MTLDVLPDHRHQVSVWTLIATEQTFVRVGEFTIDPINLGDWTPLTLEYALVASLRTLINEVVESAVPPF